MEKDMSLLQAERIFQKSKKLNLENQNFILGSIAAKLIEQGESIEDAVNDVTLATHQSDKKGA